MSFFKKITEYIKNIFGEKRVLLEEHVHASNDVVKVKEIDKLSKQYEIENLQNLYEGGSIEEETLTQQERADLISLYNDQIAMLKANIAMKNRELEEYKEKILKAKEKMSLNTNK